MFRKILFLAVYCFSFQLQSQIQRINPQFPGLKAQSLSKAGDSLVAHTSGPYLIKYDRSLNYKSSLDLGPIYPLAGVWTANDSVWYKWWRSFSGSIVMRSRDQGETWQRHPHLQLSGAGSLHFLDTNFVFEYSNTLVRYTLNGGQSYHYPVATSETIIATNDTASIFRLGGSDSLQVLDKNGLAFLAVLDSSFGMLSQGFYTSQGVFTFHGQDLIQFSATGEFQNLVHRYQSPKGGLQTFREGDSLYFVFSDSLLFSFDAGLSWQSRRIPISHNIARVCLNIINHRLVYTNGAGSILTYNVLSDQIAVHGANSYPAMHRVYPAGDSWVGFENLQSDNGQGASSVLHRINYSGQSIDTALAPFTVYPKLPLVFADSLRAFASWPGKFYRTLDGGKSWETFPDQDSVFYSALATSPDGNCLFAEGFDTSGGFLASLSNSGLRTLLGFPHQTAGGIRAIVPYSCDTLLILARYGHYLSVDGGSTFQSLAYPFGEYIHHQFKNDTLFLACRDSLYYSLFAGDPFHAIAAQPFLFSPLNYPPFHFFNRNQVATYNQDHSKFQIADLRSSYTSMLPMPLGPINQFLNADQKTFAFGEDGQAYSLQPRALFAQFLSNSSQACSSFQVYPNPSNGLIFWEPAITMNFRVMDLNGRIIKTGLSSTSLSLDGLPAGIYLIYLHSEEGSFTHKIMVQ